MGLQKLRAGAKNFRSLAPKFALGVALLAAVSACERFGGGGSTSTASGTLPAQDALSFKYERFFFGPGSQARGSVAQQLRRDAVAFPVEGVLTRSQSNPIDAEIMMHVRSMSTSGGRVSMSGDLMIRDLKFGTVMTRLENYSFTGLIPRLGGGAEPGPAIFKLIESDALAWLSGLECSTRSRLCAEPGIEPVQDITPADELMPADVGVSADGNVDLAKLANQRRGRRGEVNSGGLSPEAILAAAQPVPEAPSAPATEATDETAAAPAPAPVLAPAPEVQVALGSTVASLGLLDRSGNWLRTPLVSTETKGRVRNTATGVEIDLLLIPKDGAPGAGSQISLSALSELNASLTDLLTLIVYRIE